MERVLIGLIVASFLILGCSSDPAGDPIPLNVDETDTNNDFDADDSSEGSVEQIGLTTDVGWVELSSSTIRLFVSLTLTNLAMEESIPAGWSTFLVLTSDDDEISPSSASTGVDLVCAQDETLSVGESVTCEVAFDLGTQDDPNRLRYVGVEGISVETDLVFEEGFEEQWESYCDFAMTSCSLERVELVVPDGAFQFSVDFFDHGGCINAMDRMLSNLQSYANCTRREARDMLDYYAACSIDMGCTRFTESSYGYACLYDNFPPETCDAE